MADNDTLLGYLVPRYAKVTENAATDALAYIMNRSAACMGTLNALVQTVVGEGMEPVTRVETQVVAADGGIPDFVGFDENGDKRVVGESKFWAGLGDGQARVYLRYLSESGPSVLLFVVPEVRMDQLLGAVRADAERGGEWELGPDRIHSNGDKRRLSADVVDTKKRRAPVSRRLMMVSWGDVLTSMKSSAAGEPGTLADIEQLLGLTRREDAEAFLPLRQEELGPAFPRLMRGLTRLVDDVIHAHGTTENWLTTKGLTSAATRAYYGRYFRFIGLEGHGEELFLGVHYELWATREDTPLWLSFGPKITDGPLAQVKANLYREAGSRWTPIHLKTGVDYHELLDDVASQLHAIGEQLKAAAPGS